MRSKHVIVANDTDEALTIEEALALVDQSLNCPLHHIAALPYTFNELKEKYLSHLATSLNKTSLTYLLNKPLAARPSLAISYQAPVSELEKQIASIWGKYFGIEKVGLDDNYFDLGGDSLTALEMKNEPEHILHQELKLETLIRCQTISLLVSHFSQQIERTDSILVQLAKSANPIHVYCVHAVMGTIFPFIELGKQLGDKLNFYAIQSPHLSNEKDFQPTLQAIARRYIQSIKKQQPNGPYYLAGWSFGGLVAYEMAKQLIDMNEVVAHLCIIDMAIQSETNPNFSFSESDIKARFIQNLQNVLNKKVNENDKEFRSLFNVFQNNAQATKQYLAELKVNSPIPLICPTTIFAAHEGMLKTSPTSDLGWKPYLSHYQVIELFGDHYTILHSPEVRHISSAILNIIKRGHSNEG